MLRYVFDSGAQAQTWLSPNGELRIWKPAPHVLMTRFQGALYDTEFVACVLEATERVVSIQRGAYVFHDWEGMALYETESRTRMTEQAIQLAPHEPHFAVLLGSKMVRMGVAMASLKAGGGIRMFTRREELEEALALALGAHGGGSPRSKAG